MIKLKTVLFLSMIAGLISCNSTNENSESTEGYSPIKVAGAMKNVMWKGELAAIINTDTIENKEGLYGLGPISFLTGEIMIDDGQVYTSKILEDSSMIVEKTNTVGAPFFVYGNVTEWNEIELPADIKNIKQLEGFIEENTKDELRPFAFKLKGSISSAQIHAQNLAPGSKVSSPKEAHEGQVNFQLANENVDIIGFFSTEHQGIFTHHDSYLHMHLITKDESMMGHLDKVDFNEMVLYLPKK